MNHFSDGLVRWTKHSLASGLAKYSKPLTATIALLLFLHAAPSQAACAWSLSGNDGGPYYDTPASGANWSTDGNAIMTQNLRSFYGVTNSGSVRAEAIINQTHSVNTNFGLFYVAWTTAWVSHSWTGACGQSTPVTNVVNISSTGNVDIYGLSYAPGSEGQIVSSYAVASSAGNTWSGSYGYGSAIGEAHDYPGSLGSSGSFAGFASGTVIADVTNGTTSRYDGDDGFTITINNATFITSSSVTTLLTQATIDAEATVDVLASSGGGIFTTYCSAVASNEGTVRSDLFF